MPSNTTSALSHGLPPYTTLKKCPALPDGITFGAWWHKFRGIQNFWICTKCFQDFFNKPSISAYCEAFYDDPLPGTKSSCDFNNERAKLLLREAEKTGTVDALFPYASKRSSIGMCPGLEGARGGLGVKWYRNADLPHFVACEACFEDHVRATSFAHKFSLYEAGDHLESEIWTCDLAVPFIRRCLFMQADHGSWQSFVDNARYRMGLPRCESNAVQISSRKWYNPVQPWLIEKLIACESCLLDHVGSLPAAANFAEVVLGWSPSMTHRTCVFQAYALEFLTGKIVQKDYRLWHSLAAEVVHPPPPPFATGRIIQDEWYVLRDPMDNSSCVSNFDVCASCFAGLVKSTEHSAYFKLKKYESGIERVCDLHEQGPRYQQYRRRWQQVVFTGNTETFIEYVKRMSSLPVCARSQLVQNQRWWGFDECFFCPACYEEAGRDTYFAPMFTHQGRLDPEARCDMYSDNMRSRYIQASRQRSLDEFLAYSRERTRIFQLYQQNADVEPHSEDWNAQQAPRNLQVREVRSYQIHNQAQILKPPAQNDHLLLRRTWSEME